MKATAHTADSHGALTLQLVSAGKIVTTVELSPREHRWLQLFARDNRKTLGGFIRLAINTQLYSGHGALAPDAINVPAEVAESHDKANKAASIARPLSHN